VQLYRKQPAVRLGVSALVALAFVALLSYAAAATVYWPDPLWYPGIAFTIWIDWPSHWYLPIGGRAVYFQDALGTFVFYWAVFYGLMRLGECEAQRRERVPETLLN
jgi:hypothetical protein